MSKHPDEFGDRMKDYEGREAKRQFLPLLPIIARIDGRTFSKFTRPFRKPFDSRVANAMRMATKGLVETTHADIGYTQSDEITLIFQQDDYNSAIWFDGRVQKMTSVLASLTTAFFIRFLDEALEGSDIKVSAFPHFDARVWQVPNQTEAANTLLWRAQDARKNGISSACRSMCSAKSMNLKGQADMVAMMAEKGVDYHTAFSVADRYGTYWQRKTFAEDIDDAAWARIPEHKREGQSRTVLRSRVVDLGLEYFGDYENRTEIIFDGQIPRKAIP